MKFKENPCKTCPFVESAFLGLRRREEIIGALLNDNQTFTCHHHIAGEDIYDEDDNRIAYRPSPDDVHCAGALILLKKTGHLFDNFLFRLAVFGKLFDPDKLNMQAKVYNSIREFIEGK